MSPEGHVLNELHRRFACFHMNIVIHAIHHLGHFPREGHATCFQYKFGAVDVESLVLPRTLSAIECLLHRAENRTIRRLNSVLTRFVDVQNSSARLEDAEMVT